MKTILVATDFSNPATNAVDYAAEMAYIMNVKLVLFHACHVPVIGTEIPVEVETIESMRQRGFDELVEIAAELQNRYENQLDISYECKCGFAADEIGRYAESHHVDMILMGMQGASYLSEKLFGSVTTSVLGKSNCPVLVVNDHVKFHMLKKIVLACNIEQDHLDLPEPLRELALFFKAHIFVLDVVPTGMLVPSNPGETTDLGSFIRQFSQITHSFHFWKGENPVEGINDFVAEKNMDLVVMMPHQRPFLNRIFHPSNTKKNGVSFKGSTPCAT